ncbi:kelch domain-containing protein 1-like isoform X1 [Osmerus eperlanus]|uniref:kelch domain-containing protein 1-like isoform X1 n=1 Tax=Osmerus eperlanus TaxID=29151 RepID=UPI002E104C0B
MIWRTGVLPAKWKQAVIKPFIGLGKDPSKATRTQMSQMETRTGGELSLERSDHIAFMESGVLYVWGGCQSSSGTETVLPSDEIWFYDLDSGVWDKWEMDGEVPPALSGASGSYHNGTLYIFGGCDTNGHTNQLYSVDLKKESCIWKKVTDTIGTAPSPRDKHSCWVHRNRLIYFGGYGCKTIREVNNSKSFTVDEMSLVTTGNPFFRFWGWNNEVNVFDTLTSAWSEPETHGVAPAPRASHASATLWSKGYVCGGQETMHLDIHCLDLDTWTWTQIAPSSSCIPLGRSLHTLCPASDNTLFLYGGLGITGEPMSDGWEFDTQRREWRERVHPHRDKPRLWHSACLGKDNDVVVFGGCKDFSLLMDSITILRSPLQNHCKDILVFQNQPYPLLRLCQDCLGQNAELVQEQITWLPPKLLTTVNKKVTFSSNCPKDKTQLDSILV